MNATAEHEQASATAEGVDVIGSARKEAIDVYMRIMADIESVTAERLQVLSEQLSEAHEQLRLMEQVKGAVSQIFVEADRRIIAARRRVSDAEQEARAEFDAIAEKGRLLGLVYPRDRSGVCATDSLLDAEKRLRSASECLRQEEAISDSMRDAMGCAPDSVGGSVISRLRGRVSELSSDIALLRSLQPVCNRLRLLGGES